MLDRYIGRRGPICGRCLAAFDILIEYASIKWSSLSGIAIQTVSDPRLRGLCDALLAYPRSEWTLDDWAATAGTSARTLARLFQSELNMGFSVWRQRVRFHDAVEALAAGQPIAQVARQNGYRSASAFSAACRKTMAQHHLPSASRRLTEIGSNWLRGYPRDMHLSVGLSPILPLGPCWVRFYQLGLVQMERIESHRVLRVVFSPAVGGMPAFGALPPPAARLKSSWNAPSLG